MHWITLRQVTVCVIFSMVLRLAVQKVYRKGYDIARL